jgi:hypothetical protein
VPLVARLLRVLWMLRFVVFLDTAVLNAMSSLRIPKYSLFPLYPIIEVEAYRGPKGILQIRMVPHDLAMIIEIRSIEQHTDLKTIIPALRKNGAALTG